MAKASAKHRSTLLVAAALCACMVMTRAARAQTCTTVDDCDDGIECTTDACVNSTCVFSSDHTYCLLNWSDGDLCTTELCTGGSGTASTDGCELEPVVCAEFACATASCSPLLGCQAELDDADCDDDNPCTIDVCDNEPPNGCRHIDRPNGVVVGEAPCLGPNMCSDVLGPTTCQGGEPVTECPDYVDDIAAFGDDVCDSREVAYAIVVSTSTGLPVGTVRCFREGGVISCDKANPNSNEAKVYEGLYCPAD